MFLLGSRRRSLLLLALLITCFVGPWTSRAFAAPPPINLTVRETAGVGRSNEVLTSGIPISRALNLLGTAGLTVVDPYGTPVPAQFEVTARWGAGVAATTAPIQWLLVSFPATVGPNATANYSLVVDGSAGPNPAPARALSVSRSGNAVTVDTGAAIFRLGAGSGALFDEVVLDNGTRLIGGSQLSIRANGADYGHNTTRKVTIESQGPLSAVVVVQGVYDMPAVGKGQISTRRRYVFTAGSPTAIVRHVANWEGNLACNSCLKTSTGAINGVLVEKLRDELVVELGGTPQVTAAGNFAAPAVTGAVGAGQDAVVRQRLRASRTAPLQFEVNVAGAGATGAKADGAVLAASGPRGTVAVSLNHMHRYEPQALRVLPGGNVAVDVVDDKAWLAHHMGLYGTLAVTAAPGSLSRAELNRLTWAPVNRPLRAWPTAEWFAATGAVDEFPVGPLPADLAGYDTLLNSVLSRTVRKIDEIGLNGLMTFGLYPRYWGKDGADGEVNCGTTGDPTPTDDWDDLFWCGLWTDYHNTAATAPVWAMRTGDVEWLDELAFPGALRSLHTLIMQCSSTESWFYCGQAPSGYGAYRTDFNSSHAYLENVYLYYWLTGDKTVIDILQRGADSMRRFMCPTRGPSPVLVATGPGGPACAADYPVKLTAAMTGRVAQQWQAAFRFLGHASPDATFLEDVKSNFARAITQQYAQATRNGVQYGFWGGPALVTVPGTYQTDSQWTIGMYDMHYLDRFQKDSGDVPLGLPGLQPSQVISSVAHTYKDIEPVVVGDGTVGGLWARVLEYSWSGTRTAGTLGSVVGASRELFDPEKTGAAAVLIRAGQREGDPALVDFGKKLTIYMINSAQREGAPFGKLMGQDLSRLHTAVGLLLRGGSTTTTTPPPPPPPPPSPTAPAAPTTLTAQAVSSTAVQLTWRDNSTNETAFRIERQVGTGFQEVMTVATNVTSVQIGGLTANTAYTFRVRAGNSAGTSAYSNNATIATLAAAGGGGTTTTPPPTGSGPTAPTLMGLRWVGGGVVEVTWKDRSSNEVRFEVQRMVGGDYQTVATTDRNITKTRVGGLQSGASYTFRVKAVDSSGRASYSSAKNINTP